MQQMIYVEKTCTSKVNEYLTNGWKVIFITPAVYGNSTYNCGAYVVIEKGDDER